ncbi:hypothetical protein ABKV19_020685 [Rosa sericea]
MLVPYFWLKSCLLRAKKSEANCLSLSYFKFPMLGLVFLMVHLVYTFSKDCLIKLMPPEKGLKVLREYKMREDILDQQASLQRARLEASLADGISWGMGEDDIIEEAEDDGEEVTWQTYKGQLTEKQIKTRDKITKRMEKLAHMKKELKS